MTFLSGAWKWAVGVALVIGAFLLAMARERAIGRDQQKAEQAKVTAKTQRRIDDADANGPRTAGDASKRMRDGSF